MNEGFPPLQLSAPEERLKRGDKGRNIPLPPEVLARRHEIAAILNVKVQQLSSQLRNLNDSQRKAVFYKLGHEGVLTQQALVGTKLKVIAQPSADIILAVPTTDNLDALAGKIDAFGSGQITKQHAPSEWLAYLTDIQRADPQDRLADDLRSSYGDLIQSLMVICEIELRSVKQGKNQQKQEIESWLGELQGGFAAGVHGSLFEHEMMLPTCRAVIRCTGAMFRRLVEESEWIERIRWFDSRPQFQTFHEVVENFSVQDLAPLTLPAGDAPTVCIVDSGVTSGNPFLAGVVNEDLSRSFLLDQPNNPNDEHGHGSAVASLAAYYGLNLAQGSENRALVKIANARILDASNQIEEERLFSKILQDVVEYFVPRGIRIFCLAVCDQRLVWGPNSRRTMPRKSWVARRIDQLSRQHDIVFVTCTGNLTRQEVAAFLNDGRDYPHYLSDESAQLLDPGQAALAISVGSVVSSTTIITGGGQVPLGLQNQPSPFTRMGPGIRREIKPEVVDYGGNLAIDRQSGTVRENKGLQVVAASRSLSPAIAFWTGTSFAAPRVCHRLALIDQDLRSLGVVPSAALLRAFLVNSANHRDDGADLQPIRDAFPDDPDSLSMLLGYGLADHGRATGCDDYSVVTYFQGHIKANHVMFFDIPVPASLTDAENHVQLTVTIAHSPEVQKWGLERYLGTDLKWRMFRGDKSRDEIIEAMSDNVEESDEETGGELDLEEGSDAVLPNELAFRPTFTKRSRGTVQHATYTWKQHREEYSDGHYTLAVACFKRWQRNVAPVPIAVVVRLEDLGRSVAIYDEVRAVVEVET